MDVLYNNHGNHTEYTTVSLPAQGLPTDFRMFSQCHYSQQMFPEGQMLTVKLTVPPWTLKKQERILALGN